MHSTTYEMIVADYMLSQNRAMLVRPQFWIRAARKGRAPDVLGVDMREKIFYLAEVTARQQPAQLLEKLEDYRDGEERILCGLKHEFDVSGKWSVMTWLFIWDGLKEPLKSSIAAFGVKTTYLKELIVPSPVGIDTVPPDWGIRAEERQRLLPEERQVMMTRA
jgi:hypothetical protein